MSEQEQIIVEYNSLTEFRGKCESIISNISELYYIIYNLDKTYVVDDESGAYKGKASSSWKEYNQLLIENIDKLGKYMNMCELYIDSCIKESVIENQCLSEYMDSLDKPTVGNK